ncbi:hypothetical protein B0H67DRAFT_491563, partial [Lasiosphaeris hirsuta]
LGNDVEDTDGPPAPVKTVEKTTTHTAKRNTDGSAPAAAKAAVTSNRRGGPSGSEAAFRDRNAGADRNRGKPTDESAPRGAPRGGANARVRGGRGGGRPRSSDDRHSKHVAGGSEKQAAAGWGATEGEAELKDEVAGEEIAKTEQKEATTDAIPETEEAKEENPEDNYKTYDQYLAEVAEQKLALESERALALRKANEGIKEDKKWANTKAIVKEEGEDYFAASGGKSKRERERKVKQVVELENRYIEPERPGRGGRGGGSGRGRGDGARGDGARGRGRGAPRGEFRGNRGAARGTENRAPTAGGAPVNPNDESAFPSLGGK